jgi:hypothetical protein
VKIFLDNCVDWRAGRLFAGHAVSHAKDLGWEELENGKLLTEAAGAGFDVVVTVDKKMRSQQNLDALPVTVFEIDSPDSRLPEIQRLAPFILAALGDCRRYRFISVDQDGRTERLAERR